jgi:hypothetical protein
MNTRPRPAPPGGVFHVAHMLTANDATTLTLNDAEQSGLQDSSNEQTVAGRHHPTISRCPPYR